MAGVAAVCVGLLAACSHKAPGPAASVHYALGAPYQAGGVWRYPAERFDLVETGLAVVQTEAPGKLTADGEMSEAGTLAAGHPTLQLPAIARVTDLETGRSVVVRVNDRGPDAPGRMLALSPRTAALLGFPASGVAQVRLEVLPGESHAAVEGLAGTPSLGVQAAPRGVVEAVPLAAPAGVRAVGGVAPTVMRAAVTERTAAPPLRLPEAVTQGPADPGQLFVALSGFHGYRYAAVQRAQFGGTIEAVSSGGEEEFRVRLGPFATISEADAALTRAIGAGVPDARIVVE